MTRWFRLLLKLIKFDQFKCRELTAGEIQLCLNVFGNLIDYSKVRIMNHPYLPWQPISTLMAPEGYIHVRNKHFREDYALEDLRYQGVFIHEMTHILQYQQGQNVLLKGAILQSAYFLSGQRYDPYQYQFDIQKRFADYNIEQQGDIARDIFFKKIPNIILNQSKN